MSRSLTVLLDRLRRRLTPSADARGLVPAGPAPDAVLSDTAPPPGTRYLMIVARGQLEKLYQVRALFSDEPAVHVMVDRRRGERRRGRGRVAVERRRGERRQARDYWEDPNVHSVVLVPVRRWAEVGAAALGPGRTTTRTTEADGMDTRLEGEARERVLGWIQDGQQVLGRIIPGLFEENETLRKRLGDADREAERLRGDNDRLRQELVELKDRHQVATAHQTEIVDSVGKFVSSMSQILEPMRDLADKLQRAPRGGV